MAPREFGERYYFVQRFSGFFVPPLTSLYTFVVRSDDQSRLYLSPNMSDEHKQLIAYAPYHTSRSWNRFPEQTSAPILLEAGKAYYMDAVSNQGPAARKSVHFMLLFPCFCFVHGVMAIVHTP